MIGLLLIRNRNSAWLPFFYSRYLFLFYNIFLPFSTAITSSFSTTFFNHFLQPSPLSFLQPLSTIFYSRYIFLFFNLFLPFSTAVTSSFSTTCFYHFQQPLPFLKPFSTIFHSRHLFVRLLSLPQHGHMRGYGGRFHLQVSRRLGRSPLWTQHRRLQPQPLSQRRTVYRWRQLPNLPMWGWIRWPQLWNQAPGFLLRRTLRVWLDLRQ